MMRSNRHQTLLRDEDTLLVVTDMQEPFLRNIWQRERVISNVSILIKAAQMLRIFITPTVQNGARMGGMIPEISSLLPRHTIPYDKLSFSSLADDACASEIHRSGRKQILLCGVETHICICQTAHDLLALGYQVHVAADAVSSRSQENWEIGLSRMERSGVIISSTEMALYELLFEAGTPEFKEILNLIK